MATALLGVLPDVGVPGASRAFRSLGETRADVQGERLHLVVAVPADDTRAVLSGPRGFTTATRALLSVSPHDRSPTDAPARIADTGSGTAVRRDPGPYIPWTPSRVGYSRRPVTAPQPGRFPGTEAFTAEQQDSVLWKLERTVPYAPRVKATLAERDAMLRDEARRWAVAKELQRPVPVGAVWSEFFAGKSDNSGRATPAVASPSGGFSLPLFSPGPGKADRRRDSAIHAGNILRLQRLADLARARQDSLRRMDSIAMLTRP